MKSSIRAFYFFILFFSASSWGLSREEWAQFRRQATQEKWYEDRQWQKLLHFEENFWGQLESQIDGQNFFLSPRGSVDRAAELEASLKALESQADFSCRYPARRLWLQKKMKMQLPPMDCPDFQKFFHRVRGTGVSLVFSSYYLNNPSSAFGHTFLRINKAPAKDGHRYELLDYGINYAANKDTDNAVLYAFRGLFGFFSGVFTSTPYFYKVREYSHAESRDLWEYELNISQEAVDMMVAHMWELGPAVINYWYLTENCSYHMFSILEAADPQLELLKDQKKYVIPSDTVQVIWNKPGLVKSVHFRPSIRSELQHRAQGLNKDEISEVLGYMKNRKPSDTLARRAPLSQVRILDTLADFIDYKYLYEVQVNDSEPAQFKNQVLAQRSHIDLISEPLKINMPELEKPHEAHGSRRLDLGYFDAKDSPDRYHLDYKFALHDQLDPIVGYPEYAQITFFDVGFSHSPEQKNTELERWTLFEVVSSTPLGDFQKDLSWRIKLGTERLRNQNEDFLRWSGVSGGAGATFNLSSEPFSFVYLGVRGIGAYAPGTSTSWWAGLGPELRGRVRWSPRLVMLAELWQRYDFQGAERVYFERSLSAQWSSSQSWGWRGSFWDYGFDKVGGFEVLYYY